MLISVGLQDNSTALDLKTVVAEEVGTEAGNLEAVKFEGNKFVEYIEDDESFASLRSSKAETCFYMKHLPNEPSSLEKAKPIRCQLQIVSEKGWFTNAKLITLPRIVFMDRSSTVQDLHIEIYKKLRFPLYLHANNKRKHTG